MKRAILPDFAEARGRHLLAALSGGADSVALLCMLAERRDALHFTLSAAHINHCIRGDESRQDAEFCRELCRRLNVPLSIVEIDVPAAARVSGEGLETAARRLRYDALRRIRKDVGADFIALAHHMNDQAETVLMHLLRGCGPDGISGMEVFSGDLYRPLLHTARKDLEQWLLQRNQPWRTDSTNADDFTPRNALRLHGLPVLEESYPQAVQAIARYAEAAACENRFIERAVQDFLGKHLETGPYGMRILSPGSADEAILRRAVRQLCRPSLPYEKALEVAALGRKTRGKVEISKDLIAERTPAALYFLPKTPALPPAIPLPESGVISWSGIGRLTVSPGTPVPIRDNPLRQMLKKSALENAVLRTRRDGDRIRPLGCGEKLLSDYFTDRKIDRPLRDFVPLIASGSNILWVVGCGISEDAALDRDCCDAVCLEWTNDINETMDI